MEAFLPTSQQESDDRDLNGKVERLCKEEATLELAIEGEPHLMEVPMQVDAGSCKASGGRSQAVESEEHVEKEVSEAPGENRAVEAVRPLRARSMWRKRSARHRERT